MTGYALPIAVEHEVKAYCHHAFLLSTILTDRQRKALYSQRFVQLLSVSGARKYFFDFSDALPFYRDLVSIHSHGTIRPAELLGAIVEALAVQRYPTLYLDRHSLFASATQPEVRPYLIYGYDTADRTVSVLGFDANRFYSSLRFDYDDVLRAYQGQLELAEILGAFPVESITVREGSLSLAPDDFFLSRLRDYLEGRFDPVYDGWREGHNSDFTIPSWYLDFSGHDMLLGARVYAHLECALEELPDAPRALDYTQLHLIYEHKLCLRQRLHHWASSIDASSAIRDLVLSFGAAVDCFQLARLKLLKFSLSPQASLLTQVKYHVIEGRLREEEALTAILETAGVRPHEGDR